MTRTLFGQTMTACANTSEFLTNNRNMPVGIHSFVVVLDSPRGNRWAGAQLNVNSNKCTLIVDGHFYFDEDPIINYLLLPELGI